MSSIPIPKPINVDTPDPGGGCTVEKHIWSFLIAPSFSNKQKNKDAVLIGI